MYPSLEIRPLCLSERPWAGTNYQRVQRHTSKESGRSLSGDKKHLRLNVILFDGDLKPQSTLESRDYFQQWHSGGF